MPTTEQLTSNMPSPQETENIRVYDAPPEPVFQKLLKLLLPIALFLIIMLFWTIIFLNKHWGLVQTLFFGLLSASGTVLSYWGVMAIVTGNPKYLTSRFGKWGAVYFSPVYVRFMGFVVILIGLGLILAALSQTPI